MFCKATPTAHPAATPIRPQLFISDIDKDNATEKPKKQHIKGTL